ncbi:integrin beta-PS-like [Littorina saxatilis]|uniref:integrin beta-PS-like n=1 Tax=Littorina saxatilis TaxID=31220 RepID=UPI0038B5CF84
MKVFNVILLVTMVTLVKGAATNIAEGDTVEESCLDFWGNVCSNRGVCTFGVCRCDEGAWGKVCEDTPNSVGWCERLKPCVQCMQFNSGPLTHEECYHQCEHESSRTVFHVVADFSEDGKGCRFLDDDDCMFQFTYAFRPEEKDMIVNTLRDKECAPPRW